MGENTQVLLSQQILIYNTVLSSVVIMLYIRASELIHLIIESLYPFTSLSLLPPPLTTTIIISVSMSWLKKIFFRFHIWVIPCRASLLAQWLRIRLPIQGTRVRALVREDPTCCGATKPVCHNYWVWALEPANHDYWAHVPQLLKPAHLEPLLPTREATAMRSPRTETREKPACSNEDPMHKNKINVLKKKKWYHAVFVFVWLISVNIMPFSFIHVVANCKIFSFFSFLSLKIFYSLPFSLSLYIYLYLFLSIYLCIYLIKVFFFGWR